MIHCNSYYETEGCFDIRLEIDCKPVQGIDADTTMEYGYMEVYRVILVNKTINK
jgi:hypothetical protein